MIQKIATPEFKILAEHAVEVSKISPPLSGVRGSAIICSSPLHKEAVTLRLYFPEIHLFISRITAAVFNFMFA